ncbi:uncharacterized protein [Anabrus simplex]|uniref:uncharacterized protein n=1 Tax=Anabrus simplex TaxID=316456 RepID=UPI0035A29083
MQQALDSVGKGPPKSSKKAVKKQKTSAQDIQSKVASNSTDMSLQVPTISRRGLKRASSAVDRDLWLWYCSISKKRGGKKVSKQLVQARAKWAFHRAGIADFKASDGWYRRWIKRWKCYSPVMPDIPVNDASDTLENNSCHPIDSLEILREVATKELKQEILEQENQAKKNKACVKVNTSVDGLSQNIVKTEVSSNNGEKPKTTCMNEVKTGSTNVVPEIEFIPCEITSEGFAQHGNDRNNSVLNIENALSSSTILAENDQQCPSRNSKNIDSKLLNLSDVLNLTTSDDSGNLLNFSGIIGVMPQELSHPNTDIVAINCGKDSFPQSSDDSGKNNCDSASIHLSADKLKDLANWFFPKCNDKSSSPEIATLTFSTETPPSVSVTLENEGRNSSIKDNYLVKAHVEMIPSSVMENPFKEYDPVNSIQNTSEEYVQNMCVSSQDTKSQNSELTLSTGTKSTVLSKFELCKNGKRYLPHFKDKVLSYVANHTLKETAKKFSVHQGSITTWKKDKARKKLTSRRAAGRNKGSSVLSIDEQFLTWLRQQRGREFTGTEVQDYAKQLVIQYGGQGAVERQSRWFAMWVLRFEEKPYHEGMENTKHSGEEERRIQYPPAFRTEVAAFADSHSQMKAARIFNVSRKRVFEWLKMFREKKDKEAANVLSAGRQSSGRTVTDGDIDQQIWIWYKTCLAEGRKPKGIEVRTKGLALYRERGHSGILCSYGWYKRWCDRFGVILRHDGDDEMLEWTLTQLDCNRSLTHHDLQEQARNMWSRKSPEFKASSGWAIRFCRRHPKLLQQTPTVETPLPVILQRNVEPFRSRIQNLIREKPFSLGVIGSMDELPLNFSAPLSNNSKRHLLLRKPGTENCHATILLACLADGNMLPPTIILKKNTLDSQACDDDDVGKDLLVLRQEDGLLDDSCMNQWLDLVWFKHVPGPNLLIMDCYGPHTSQSVREKFANCASELGIIPGGCTSKLQPLDVSIKRIFQMCIGKLFAKLNSQPANTWGCTSKFHMPTSSELLGWVRQTYHYIQTNKQETVRRSFLVTGFTVSSNHSEDHFIENLSVMPTDDSSDFIL